MPRRSDEAFVLTRYPFRERDLIVVALGRDSGLVRLLARRARGARGAAAGRLEVLSLVRLTFFERRQSELASLDEVALLRSAFPLSARPAAWAAGQVLAELALLFSPPGQRLEAMFRLVDRCLLALLGGHDPLAVVDYASVWTVRLAGVLPDVERCGVCGALLPETPVRYDEQAQGLVCAGHGGGGRLHVSPRSRRWLQAVLTSPPERIAEAAPADARQWVEQLRRAFLERDLATLATFHALVGGPPAV